MQLLFPYLLQTALFKLLDPGLFIYHCAAAPLPTHVANDMYGMVPVEPAGGLPAVDREFCVVQSEVYAHEGEVRQPAQVCGSICQCC
jgi:hypothetical protein